jgi:hypothetical protein
MNIELPMEEMKKKIEEEKLENLDRYMNLEESIISTNRGQDKLKNQFTFSLPFNPNQNKNKIPESDDEKKPEVYSNSRWKKFKDFFTVFKYILFTFMCVSGSIINFSYLNFTYTFFGSFIILLFLTSGDKKIVSRILRITLYFLISYTSAVILFKLAILLILWTRGNSPGSFLQENKILLIDLGLKFLEDNSIAGWVITFLSDALVFLFYFIFRIYRFHLLNQKSEKEKIKIDENYSKLEEFLFKFEGRQILMMFLQIIFISSFNSTYVNFLSFFYSLMFILFLLLWSVGVVRKALKILNIFIAYVSFTHFTLFHFFNIYSYRTFYINSYDKERIFKWLGIVKMSPQFYVRKII